MMKRLFPLITVLLISHNTVLAKGFTDTAIANAAHAFLSDKPFASLQIGIVKQKDVYRYNFGLGNSTNLFEIGSITKTFTSLILAHAILEKRVKPGDDVRTFLSGTYPNLQYEEHPIQLIQLANLTSGLPNSLPEPDDFYRGMNYDSMAFSYVALHRGYTKMQFLSDLHNVKLDTIPGVVPRHSNAAAQLLGYVLENIYHQPLSELIKKYITKPLKMKHTFLFVPKDMQKMVANGHSKEGRNMPLIPDNSAYAFGLKSNLGDMLRYIRYQLYDSGQALKMAHQATWGDKRFAIAMNWLTSQGLDGKIKFFGDGTTLGFTTCILLYPQQEFGIVAMSNIYTDDTNDQLGQLAERIYEEVNYSVAERSADGFGFSANINLLSGQLNIHGFEQAAQVYEQLKHQYPDYHVDEEELNQWAYTLLAKGKKQAALAIFRLNVSLYPESFNAYDSLGEIYEILGDNAMAIKNYQKSLDLNPRNDNAANHLKKLRQ